MPKLDPIYSTTITSRWCRAQTAFWNRPPTQYCKSGYACVYVPTEGRCHQDGIYKVGLRARYDKTGLQQEANECEMQFNDYVDCLSKSLDDVITVKDRKSPYIVDLKNKTCTCPDFQHRKLPCFHMMAVMYGLTVGYTVGKYNVMKFKLGGE